MRLRSRRALMKGTTIATAAPERTLTIAIASVTPWILEWRSDSRMTSAPRQPKRQAARRLAFSGRGGPEEDRARDRKRGCVHVHCEAGARVPEPVADNLRSGVGFGRRSLTRPRSDGGCASGIAGRGNLV